MNELDDLFREARMGLAPSPADLERGKRNVRAAIAGGAAAVVTITAAKTAGASAAGASVSVLAVAAAVIAAGGGTALYVMHKMHSAPATQTAPARIRAAAIESAPAAVAAPVAAAVPVAASDSGSGSAAAAASVTVAASDTAAVSVPAAVALPAPTRVKRTSHPSTSPSTSTSTSTVADVETSAKPSPPQDRLALELAAVRDADAALRAHDPTHALELVHAVHPDQLAAELAAIEIDALCALDRRDDARALATDFTLRFPRSTLHTRVTRSCAKGSP